MPTLPHPEQEPQLAMLVLQAWEPSLPPWLDPLLPVLVLLLAARAVSALSALFIIKLAEKRNGH